MTLKSILPLVVATSSLIACGGGTPAPTDSAALAANAAPDITGHWVSECTKVSEQQIIKLDFQMTKETWSLDYSTFADPACQTKFVTVHIEGPYQVGGPAEGVEKAFQAKFGFTKKTVTPHLDAAVGFLGSEKGCGGSWTLGTTVDIGEKGCAGLGQRPISACGADYDLVFTDGSVITFGDRPADNDMCTEDKRPKALSKLSMKKIP